LVIDFSKTSGFRGLYGSTEENCASPDRMFTAESKGVNWTSFSRTATQAASSDLLLRRTSSSSLGRAEILSRQDFIAG
jgi:hypothetical protein